MVLTKITYSLPNLKGLVNSSNSCIYCIENCSRSLTLLPVHLDNIKHSVNELLAAKVATFDTVLKGIILGHKNIKVINHVQLNDDGNFGLDYVADVYIFKPENGNLLSGEVNKKGNDHIGVLVHSFFNATIPRPRVDSECPRSWVGFDVNIGQLVTFEVVKSNLTGRLPCIIGKLIDIKECDNEDGDSGIGGHESTEENSFLKDVPLSLNGGDSKKKKKKKSLLPEEHLNKESNAKLKKKKKKSVNFGNEKDLQIASSVDIMKNKKEYVDFECEEDRQMESCVDAVKKKKKKSSVELKRTEDLQMHLSLDVIKKKKRKKSSTVFGCEEDLQIESSVDVLEKKKKKVSSVELVCEEDLQDTVIGDEIKRKKKKKSIQKGPREENIQLEFHRGSEAKKKKLSVEHEENSQIDASGNKGKRKKRSFQEVDCEEVLKIEQLEDECQESSRTDLKRPKKKRKLSI